MNRITQREKVLQFLKENSPKFVPVWWFVGERLSTRWGWVLLSHRAPARLTELFQEGLVERKMVRGRAGSHYYSYKYIPEKNDER